MGLADRYLARRALVAENTLGDNVIVDAVVGKRLIVVAFGIVNAVATAQAVTFKSGDDAVTGAMALPSAIGGDLSLAEGEFGLFEAARGEDLVLALVAATAVGGFVSYVAAG